MLSAALIAISLIGWLYIAGLARDMGALVSAPGAATHGMAMSGMPDMPEMEHVPGEPGSSGMPGVPGMPELPATSGMSGMPLVTAMAMPSLVGWSAGDVALTFVMWAVMMIAMMTPTALPMILTFAGLERLGGARAPRRSRTAIFFGAYLLVWMVSSVVATLLQWGLHTGGLLVPNGAQVTPAVGGLLLISAGTYQFTAWKQACLAKCRSPADFLMTEWRDGARGALIMGVRHGAYCLGCCWLLILLLFVAGVMNLLWVAFIAAYVLAEKLVPWGRWLSRPAGALAAIYGVWLLGQPLLG